MAGRQYDKGHKLLFNHPEFVKDLICGFLHDEWMQELEWDSLERVSGHYVTDDMRERIDDVVWRIKVNHEWAYLYLLIEFQSGPDLFMPIRVLTYTGLLYQDLIRQNSQWNVTWWREGRRLPVILPIVLYSGGPPWTTPVDMAGLLPDKVPDFLARYLPAMRFCLLSERELVEASDIATMENLLACIMRIEHPGGEEGFRRAREDLAKLLAKAPYQTLARSVHIWLHQMLRIDQTVPDALENAETLEEMSMHISQYLDQREKELRQLGRTEGRTDEGSQLLLRLLSQRFGNLPSEITDRVHQSDIEQIHLWVDRILTAQSLEDVFDTRH